MIFQFSARNSWKTIIMIWQRVLGNTFLDLFPILLDNLQYNFICCEIKAFFETLEISSEEPECLRPSYNTTCCCVPGDAYNDVWRISSNFNIYAEYRVKLSEVTRDTSPKASPNNQAHNNKKYYRKGGNKHPGSLLEVSKNLESFYFTKNEIIL